MEAENEQHLGAEFWARLSSIEDLQRLREGERLLLVEDFKEKVLAWLNKSLQKDPNNYPFNLTFGLDAPLYRALTLLHRDARQIIGDLLDGKTITAPLEALPRLTWTLKENALQEHIVDSLPTLNRLPVPEIYNHFLVELIHILRQRPFPFRRCPVCQRVFVPFRKQKYCSPNCAAKGVELARKESKREYMKTYMADRRRRAKRAKQRAQQGGRKEK